MNRGTEKTSREAAYFFPTVASSLSRRDRLPGTFQGKLSESRVNKAARYGSTTMKPGNINVDDLDVPPWEPDPEERATSDRSMFGNCESLLHSFATRDRGKISNETYTISQKFGKILRAKVTS